MDVGEWTVDVWCVNDYAVNGLDWRWVDGSGDLATKPIPTLMR